MLRENADVCKCEYLVIWCDKTTVHEIIDCNSISASRSESVIQLVGTSETLWRAYYNLFSHISVCTEQLYNILPDIH
jgi:hypothetical protein